MHEILPSILPVITPYHCVVTTAVVWYSIDHSMAATTGSSSSSSSILRTGSSYRRMAGVDAGTMMPMTRMMMMMMMVVVVMMMIMAATSIMPMGTTATAFVMIPTTNTNGRLIKNRYSGENIGVDASNTFAITRTSTTAATAAATAAKAALKMSSSSTTDTSKDTDKNSNNNNNDNVSIEQVQEELKQVQIEVMEKLEACTTLAEAEALRRDAMGKKGPIQGAMKYMRNLSSEDKPRLGAVVNEIKDSLEILMSEAKDRLELQQLEQQMENQKVDVTMPGLMNTADIGRRHPLSMTMEKAVDIFVKLGYDTVTGCEDSPEIETDYYCFEALNCPKDHPARDMQDTFYLREDRELMLRTHTSAVQIRQLEKRKPPLRIVAPGRVYRRDDIDATHSLMFHQVEILALEPIGELDLGHLKGTVEHFLKEMLGPQIETRFRGSYFPFTEPSMEVDVKFRGKWMEVLGCGMVDPAVLEMAGIDPTQYAGFAAGFGVERFAMIIHGIKDLREFVKSDVRFLRQFPHFYDDGLTTFLAGEPPQEPPEELRTDQFPQSIVESWEELRDYKYDTNVATATATATAPVNKNGDEAKTEDASSAKKPEKTKSPPPASADAAADATEGDAAAAAIDISKLDIRVGLITKAWEHPEADKLFCEEIDLGEEGGPRQIASGLKAYYSVDDLVGRKVLVLANLKARKLVGFPSHGMVLCAASNDDDDDDVNGNKKVQFIDPPEGAKVGERVMVEGYDNGEPATENQVIKKKMLEAIFPDLRTNGDGVATYKGVPLTTSAGPCRSGLSNVPIG